MEFLIKSLPIELKNHILAYLYNTQPFNLCNDIKSYRIISIKAKDIYNSYWKKNPDIAKDWLINDTIRFVNEDVPTMYGFQNFYKTVIKRHFNCNYLSEEEVNQTISRLEDNSCCKDSNIFKIILGLLLPEERTNLLEFYNKIYSRRYTF